MKLHVVQKLIVRTDITPYLDKAQAAGVDLVCFAELATTGCLYAPQEVEAVEVVADRFNDYNMHIMLGLPCVNDMGAYNSYMLWCQGEIDLYHKINLYPPFGEPDLYLPGKRPGVWRTALGTFGVAICYDIRFPKVFEDLRSSGVNRIVIPAAFPRERIGEWRALVIDRARMTHCDVIAINSVGHDGRHEFGGTSMVVRSDGVVLAEADQTSETVLEVELD